MIKYALRCAHDHTFDSWFANAAAYDTVAAAGGLSCIVCGSSDVAKAIMAPAVGRKTNATLMRPTTENGIGATTDNAAGATADNAAGASAANPAGGSRAEAAKAVSPPPAPGARALLAMAAKEAALRHMLATLKREVQSQCEDVGDGFAKEARAIHEGEAPERGIYGRASGKEVEALLDDGIPVLPLPPDPEPDQ